MKYLFAIILIAFTVLGCKEIGSVPKKISSGKKAESVFLSHDHNGNPVVEWTERSDDKVNLSFAVSADDGNTFSESVAIPLEGDVATHAESMPKIAFKKDGTIIVGYEKKAPTKENKYAGSIYYKASNDGGKTWTAEKYMHSDTIAGRSRSYFDLESLPNGEVGASWLDIKLNNETGGRSVLFATTDETNAFKNEILVDSSACQCCRIDVYADVNKNVYVAYRGLKKGKMGSDIRDMMIATSVDNGKTFSSPLKISNDNWSIDGCPHTGPSLCSNKAGLFTLWYTEGHGTGIFSNHKPTIAGAFSPRELVSNAGYHPQLCANDNLIAMVWEENADNNGKPVTSVHYRIIEDGNDLEKNVLTPKDVNSFLPVVTQTKDGFLTAYLREENDIVSVYLEKL